MMSSNHVVAAKVLACGLLMGLVNVTAFAEPAVQAGETLESLSQAKITTSINGQPGSIQELVQSGQVRLVNPENSSVQPSPAATADLSSDASTAVSPSPSMSSAPQLDSSAAHPVNAAEAEIPSSDQPEAEQNLQVQPMPTENQSLPAQ
ncbi:hypothetical protein [Acinetobacter kanungonis]|uniref:hypothetical protein n=1 Tax=Acinetobacter kanungonis TaxID=2699469 RepID=UPI00137B6570|nr:hypothetical protein [Acinetobacter kanungonis]NCI77935.1 hypothetical protein [Acinetobacter kanungonis]